jgi:hypothetical protein
VPEDEERRALDELRLNLRHLTSCNTLREVAEKLPALLPPVKPLGLGGAHV